ncbi:MAG: JAB domain-containing protein [Sphingobacterium sp.]|jgi:DNA repair protein RadC|nr:JAB domain-containing protein [Sphingobacterium sp.]
MLNSSVSAYEVLKKIYNPGILELIEEFYVLFLDCKLRVLGYYMIGRGGIDHVAVDSRIIFALTLKTASTHIILSHNHPSNFCQPSRADLEMTRHICQRASIFGIKVIDHIIFTSHGYYSFRDNKQF